MKDKLKKLENKSFNEWMESNFQKEYLENKMIQAAKEGYTAVVIEVSKESNDEAKRMKLKPEFIECLKNMFPELDVREEFYTQK